MTAEYVQTDRFRGARIHRCDLAGLEIRDCEVSGLKIVDVTMHIEAEHHRDALRDLAGLTASATQQRFGLRARPNAE